MGLFRGAVSRLRAVLGTAALLSAAACGTAEEPPGGPTVSETGATDGLVTFDLSAYDPAECQPPEHWQEMGRKLCARFAATVREAEVPPGEGCEAGLARSVNVTCEGELLPEKAPDRYSFTGILGGADQCRTSADWAQLAAELCNPEHAPAKVSPERECGEGQSRYARVTCRVPLQTLPPPPACTLQRLSGVCALPEHWSQMAQQHCANKGLVLGETAVAPGMTCGAGGFDVSWLTCCTPEVPPEPLEECRSWGVEAPSGTCQSTEYWQESARTFCGDKGMTLRSSSPLSPCGNDTFRYTSVTCCR